MGNLQCKWDGDASGCSDGGDDGAGNDDDSHVHLLFARRHSGTPLPVACMSPACAEKHQAPGTTLINCKAALGKSYALGASPSTGMAVLMQCGLQPQKRCHVSDPPWCSTSHE